MTPSDTDFPTDLRALEENYELIRELGQSGMAAVYLARRRDTGKLVAVKAVRARYLDDAEALQRFAREARTVAGLSHPNIVATEAIEEMGDRAVAIIREYIGGGTVRDRLREYGAFAAEDAERVLRDVASALAYAHKRGIVHRDVKPENVFLDKQGGRALLADFGIARRIEGDVNITMHGASLGTPQYMSPEQIDGRAIDGRSDIYSLGVLGWELLTGRRPWAGENLYGTIYKQKHENLPKITSLRPRVPANLLVAIERALEKNRDRRWQTVDQFLEHLTYEPPPLLAQSYPSPIEMWSDDQPTVKFRRSSVQSPPNEPPPHKSGASIQGPEAPQSPEAASPPRRRLRVTLALAIPLVVAGFAWYALFGDPARVFARKDAAGEVATASASPDSATPPVTPVSRPEPAIVLAVPTPRCRIATTADQEVCLRAYIRESDAPLQRVYDSLIVAVRRNAHVSGVMDPPEVSQLRVEQRRWVAERERVCMERRSAAIGLWAGPLATCFKQQADARTGELRSALRQARQQSR
jgi:serine/threonine protein kinase/uncharacterized protein YecT (DUF1311 family)